MVRDLLRLVITEIFYFRSTLGHSAYSVFKSIETTGAVSLPDRAFPPVGAR